MKPSSSITGKSITDCCSTVLLFSPPWVLKPNNKSTSFEIEKYLLVLYRSNLELVMLKGSFLLGRECLLQYCRNLPQI